MTADEIMHVLRLTAMGRVNHPDQQRLCEALERVIGGAAHVEATVDTPAEAPKRGPGRPKKAE